MKVVQELLRHSSSRITTDVSAQAQTQTKRAAEQKVVEMVRAARLQVEAENMVYLLPKMLRLASMGNRSSA